MPGIGSVQGRSTASDIGSRISAEAVTCPAAVCTGVTPMRAKRRPNVPAKPYDSVAPRQASWASRFAPSPASAAGPIITATPAKPISTPASRPPVIFSSLVRNAPPRW